MSYMKDATGRRLDTFPISEKALTHLGLSLIAECRVNPSAASPGFQQCQTSRISVIPTVSSSHVVLAFANITGANGLGEYGGDANVRVEAALEYYATSVTTETAERVPATFNGLRTGELLPGSVLFSDPIPFDVVSGIQFFSRVNMQTAGSALGMPLGFNGQGGTAAGAVGNGDATSAYAATAWGTTGGTGLSGATTAVGHVAILGYTNSPVASAAILGDSIQAGVGDAGFGRNDGGYLVRALTGQMNPKYTFPITPLRPFVRLARGGETLNQFLNQASSLNSLPTFSAVRSRIANLASTILFAYGTNDLGSTLSTIQANYVKAANSFLRRGKTFVACTLLPRTTSTDGWITTTNQTGIAAESDRQAFNTWLRNGTFAAATAVPAKVAVFDGAAAVEVNSAGTATLNGGYWAPPSTGSTPSVTSTVTSGSSTTAINDTTKAWTQDQWRGYVLRFTSGANANTQQVILSNTATQVLVGGFTTAPTTGDNYQIMQSNTVDGTHPTSLGHARIATAFNLGVIQ